MKNVLVLIVGNEKGLLHSSREQNMNIADCREMISWKYIAPLLCLSGSILVGKTTAGMILLIRIVSKSYKVDDVIIWYLWWSRFMQLIRKRHPLSLFSAVLALPPLGKIPSLVKEESRVRSRRDQTFDETNKLEYLNICVWPKCDCLVDSRLDLRPLDGRRLPWWQQRFHTSQVFSLLPNICPNILLASIA